MRLEDQINPAKQRTQLVPGFATENTDEVLVGGVLVPAFWTGHVDVQENDPLWVLMIDRPNFTSTAVVIGANGDPTGTIAEPSTGTVTTAPIGADTVKVQTTAGETQAAFPITYTPEVSDKVRLLWQDGEAWILGKSSKVPAPRPKKPPKKDKPSVPAPPSKNSGGQESFTAADSATWSSGTGSWNSRIGKDVYQGSWPSTGSNRGAWFYHNRPKKLRSKRATKTEMWVPKRISAGNHKSSITLRLYLHGSAKRPGRDVNRSTGFSLSIPAGWKGGWRPLPTSWGDELIAGNGIGLSGGGYAGFEGVGKSKRSGQIRITWED